MINRGNSGDSDGDEVNDDRDSDSGSDSDGDEEEQGEDKDEDDDNDESFLEIDTEEVFELLAKGKSYATFKGTQCTHCTAFKNFLLNLHCRTFLRRTLSLLPWLGNVLSTDIMHCFSPSKQLFITFSSCSFYRSQELGVFSTHDRC